MLYVIWNNGSFQPAMGFWLKSFNKKPNPVPGTHFTIPEINYREYTRIEYDATRADHKF